MKTKLLAFLLAMFSTISVFAQTINGETKPCPGVAYDYEITLPNLPSGRVEHGRITNQTSIPTGTSFIHRFTVIWDNFYQLGSNGLPVESKLTLQVANQTTEYTFKVVIKGLADVQFISVPAPACNFRGEVPVSVNLNPNATKYVWTNNAGWGNNNAETSTPGIKFIVNNDLPALVAVKVYNTNCGTTMKQNSVNVNRTPVTTTPVFNANTSKVLCPGVTGSASISGAEGTPIRYEWYALPL